MKHGFTLLLAGAALSSLTACSGGADNKQDAAADNMAMPADANMAANNPFAESEQRMNDQMMAAVGVNAGDTFLRKMIVHHQGALDMSRIVLEQNPSAEVAAMARDAIAKQGKEIEQLQKFVKQGTPDPKSAEIYRPVMMEMQQAMMQAKGANVSETFLKKMLAHHEGGAELADMALDKGGVTGALRAQVEKTHDGQHEDAEMTEAMLSGKAMGSMKGMHSPTAANSKAGSSPTKTEVTVSKGMPVPGTNTVESVVVPMNNMSNMSGMNHM